jgi:hypothetical protein
MPERVLALKNLTQNFKKKINESIKKQGLGCNPPKNNILLKKCLGRIFRGSHKFL